LTPDKAFNMKQVMNQRVKVCNFGSINIDHVYSVEHFVRPGETLNSVSYSVFAGGKGFNQSIALAHAGVHVFHAGKIGAKDTWLIERLKKIGVDTTFIESSDSTTGHAVIQVTPSGDNAIFLFGGANKEINHNFARERLSHFFQGDYLLVQNEISAISDIISIAHSRKMTIVFNPAPMNEEVLSYPLDAVDIFIVNEVEGAQLTKKTFPDDIITSMKEDYPHAAVVLTLGENGVMYADGKQTLHVPAYDVTPVDTTAAGDTFIGFFVGALIQGATPRNALTKGCKASALCITKKGAADSIPNLNDIETVKLETRAQNHARM